MNERDRLIELLRDRTDFAPNLADALLAAGVGFPRDDEAFAAGRLAEAVDAADRADIDVERLARALRVFQNRHDDPEHAFLCAEPGDDPDYDRLLLEDAAAIAAAYREDAGSQ